MLLNTMVILMSCVSAPSKEKNILFCKHEWSQQKITAGVPPSRCKGKLLAVETQSS